MLHNLYSKFTHSVETDYSLTPSCLLCGHTIKPLGSQAGQSLELTAVHWLYIQT